MHHSREESSEEQFSENAESIEWLSLRKAIEKQAQKASGVVWVKEILGNRIKHWWWQWYLWSNHKTTEISEIIWVPVFAFKNRTIKQLGAAYKGSNSKTEQFFSSWTFSFILCIKSFLKVWCLITK